MVTLFSATFTAGKMKTILYYIFFLGVFFTNVSHAHSLQPKQDIGFSDSFQKAEHKYSFRSYDSKSLVFSFESDFLSDDDDDEITSLKRKVSFTNIAFFGNNQFTIKPFHKNLQNKVSYVSFSNFLFSEFISLRVLKL